MLDNDTILAISSAPISSDHAGSRGIVRLSGPHAWQLAAAVVQFSSPPHIGWNGNLPVPALHPTLPVAAALLFKSPKSFTGEDIAELHLPGTPALLRDCLDRLLAIPDHPARMAIAGEFTARAFFNRKLDLTQAEGIAASIHATTDTQLRAATSLRDGHLFRKTDALAERVASLLALLEAGIDFSDESDVSFLSATDAAQAIAELQNDIDTLRRNAVRLDHLDTLPTVALAGLPNVGKSSLINALTQTARAITSPTAGTTRDLLRAVMETSHGPIALIDVPGEEAPTTELQTQMMEARQRALDAADLILHVIDTRAHTPIDNAQFRSYGTRAFLVLNKSDLHPPANDSTTPIPSFVVSAATSQGLDTLKSAIAVALFESDSQQGEQSALNARHRAILQGVHTLLDSAHAISADPLTFHRHPELLAADLRRALDALGQITGTISPDDVLGRIFSHFCVGK